MSARLRLVGLPLVAVVLVAGVLGVQLSHGGSEFEPTRTADPCAARTVTSTSTGIDGLVERLVLLGIDGAACTSGTSREAFTLALAEPGERTDAQVEALRGGLVGAVRRLEDEGTLPASSELVNEALDGIDLNRFLVAALRALPDSVIDSALRTDDVLVRTIEDLDLRSLLANLDDRDDLNRQIEDAVVPAVRDSLVDRLKNLV